MLLSTDRRVLTNIRDSNKGYTFKELCDLSGVQAGDITKSLQYLVGKDFIQSIERPEGRVFLITETGAQELNGNAEPEDLKCRYCEKPYTHQGWLDQHEAKCKKRLDEGHGDLRPVPEKRSPSLMREASPAKPAAVERTRGAIAKMFPEPRAWTIRCSGCGSLYSIKKRECGAELLECPLCMKA